MKDTPQNQYFPANAERMAEHCLESGCIGKYTPSHFEISLGQGLRPRRAKFCIPRPSGSLSSLGVQNPQSGKSLGPRGMYFPKHPSSRQCSDTFFSSCLSVHLSSCLPHCIDITTLEDSNVGTLRNISINIDMGVGYGFHIEQIDLLGSIVLVA